MKENVRFRNIHPSRDHLQSVATAESTGTEASNRFSSGCHTRIRTRPRESSANRATEQWLLAAQPRHPPTPTPCDPNLGSRNNPVWAAPCQACTRRSHQSSSLGRTKLVRKNLRRSRQPGAGPTTRTFQPRRKQRQPSNQQLIQTSSWLPPLGMPLEKQKKMIF